MRDLPAQYRYAFLDDLHTIDSWEASYDIGSSHDIEQLTNSSPHIVSGHIHNKITARCSPGILYSAP